MRRNFSAYYEPTDSESTKLWKDCLFILDANVLLNLYEYHEEDKNDFIKNLSIIAKANRLWIPHQVALEYQENRLGVIAKQVERFDQVRKSLRNFRTELKPELKKRHSTIDPKNFLKNVEKEFSDFEASLDRLKKKQPGVSTKDTIRDELDELLDGKIGAPLSFSELAEVYQEGETRYEHKCPPGYEDAEKGKASYFYGGSTIRRKFGDLILWFQIINEVKTRETKNVIFVTDDGKKDWWWKAGEKTIGPRPELVSEIVQKGGVSLFWMYSWETFMPIANTNLKGLGVRFARKSIKEAQEIAKLRRSEVVVSIDSPTTVTEGGKFYVNVNINAVTNLASGQYGIAYNPAVIQIIGPEGGPAGVTGGLVGGTPFNVVMWTFSPLGTPGAVVALQSVASVLFPASGTGNLARVHFQALPGTAGQSSFINIVDLPLATPPVIRGLWNSSGSEITGVTWTNGSVSVVR